MGFLLGLLIAGLAIAGSVFHLKQLPSTYFDFVGMVVVFGGTAAVAAMVLPWRSRREMGRMFGLLLGMGLTDPKRLGAESLGLVRTVLGGGAFSTNLKGLAAEVLRDGFELIQLGFGAGKIERILIERIEQSHDRSSVIYNGIRTLSKYPPAFGLVGTVLGLVSLMRAVSDGASSQETGVRMAVALVATLYGLLLANLVLSPAGERVQSFAVEEKKAALLALEAVLLASERVSLLEAQESLNSYLAEKDRLDLLSGAGGSQAA
jgi:chemotaxis protein MotA